MEYDRTDVIAEVSAAFEDYERALVANDVDRILGFFAPGVGDVIGAALGLYLLTIAGQRRVAPIVIARMLLNLTVDMVVGLIPFAGDLGDFAFRANKRNLALLEARADNQGKATWKDWAAVVGAAALCGAALIGVVWLAIATLRWIF